MKKLKWFLMLIGLLVVATFFKSLAVVCILILVCYGIFKMFDNVKDVKQIKTTLEQVDKEDS